MEILTRGDQSAGSAGFGTPDLEEWGPVMTGRTDKTGQGIGFAEYVVDDRKGLIAAVEPAEPIAPKTAMTNLAVVHALLQTMEERRT
jgi:hypothetical protein